MQQQFQDPDSRTAMKTQFTDTGKRLHYRRQFVLARAPVSTLSHWNSLKIGEYFLCSHPDLEINTISDGKKTIVLIGYLFDSVEYLKSNSDILADIMHRSHSYQDVILAIKQYAGRYVLIYQDESSFQLVQDALSLREVYYCTEDNLVLCGSQPNLVAACASPKLATTKNPEVDDFFKNQMKSVRNRSLWVGDGTYYDGIKHLLPNHCLDLKRRSVQRYWPNTELRPAGLEETVDKACRFLQGMMKAVTHRHPAMVAVTAGTDSRTLLAASRGITDKIYFFINKERTLDDKSSDLDIPKRLFSRINVPFHVHDVPNVVDEEFRRVFLNNTFYASERILPTIYNVYFKNCGDKINILGVGEIGRALWGKAPRKVSAYYLAYVLGYKKSPYATRECEQWLQEIMPVAKQYRIDTMTLLLWEQLLGNWGTVGNSESDIAIEEFDPYDSHYLYETFLGIDEKCVKGNRHIIFREMLRRMWPELLEYPINPPDTNSDRVVSLLKTIGVHSVLKALKYQLHRFRYVYLLGGRSS